MILLFENGIIKQLKGVDLMKEQVLLNLTAQLTEMNSLIKK